MEKTDKYQPYKHRDLIEGCLNNDRKAQVKIYDLYYKSMYNASLRIVNDTLLAEDIMQESFLDAFKKLNTFEWRSSFGSWLKRIVVNKSLDKIRKKYELVDIDDVEDELAYEDEETANSFFEYKIEDVKYALKLLPEKYKLVLVLFLFEGYDHQEIAQITGLPYNNVRVRYMRAKNKLISKIKESKSTHVLN